MELWDLEQDKNRGSIKDEEILGHLDHPQASKCANSLKGRFEIILSNHLKQENTKHSESRVQPFAESPKRYERQGCEKIAKTELHSALDFLDTMQQVESDHVPTIRKTLVLLLDMAERREKSVQKMKRDNVELKNMMSASLQDLRPARRHHSLQNAAPSQSSPIFIAAQGSLSTPHSGHVSNSPQRRMVLRHMRGPHSRDSSFGSFSSTGSHEDEDRGSYCSSSSDYWISSEPEGLPMTQGRKQSSSSLHGNTIADRRHRFVRQRSMPSLHMDGRDFQHHM